MMRLKRRIAALITRARLYPGYPPGHFYSPVVDVDRARAEAERIWRRDTEVPGIDFNDPSHFHYLTEVFPAHLKDYDYPEMLEETPDLNRFFTRNTEFSWLDARALFVMLRHLRPKRMIEIGGGFSSLLTADVNQRFLGNAMHFACIEPYPRAFLRHSLPGLSELRLKQVQEMQPEYFAVLQGGDVLFIDSSHVSKTGSDVNYLFFEILPRLRSGVYVHFHDIFLPHEYPMEWVLDEFRSWNEQYLLRALLMHSSSFRIVFGCYYANMKYPQLVEKALGLEPGRSFGGSSIWLQRQ